ncbi:MAG: sigma-70 family RNA polymerase sigma factor [Planctomycetota bacterium]
MGSDAAGARRDGLAREPKSKYNQAQGDDREPRKQGTGVEDGDRSDIEATLAGDDDAFRRLVERYETPIARLMWRFARDRGQCEELTQDVFVEAYLSLNTYRGEAPFLHWLRRIGTRVGYRFWRRRGRESDTARLDDVAPQAAASDPIDPAAAAEIVDRLLAQLAPDDRLVLTLAYLEGSTMKEIAEQTGWTEDAAKMRAYRARGRLREIAERAHLLEALGWTS